MILTPLIDINNLNLSTFWTFVVIDDKEEKNKDINVLRWWKDNKGEK